MRISIKAPDGWICDVEKRGEGAYSPVGWKISGAVRGRGVPQPPSAGIRRFSFTSPSAAMMAAYRERQSRGEMKLSH